MQLLILAGMLSGGKWDKLHDMSRRVYDVDGVSPAIPTTGGGHHEVKILEIRKEGLTVKEATKKGYAIVKEGDSVDLNYTNSNTRRGRVGKGIAHTITAYSNSQAVLVGAIRGRNPDNPCDRTAGIPLTQTLELRKDDCTNTITTVQKDNVVVEAAGIYTRASKAFQRGPLRDKSRSIRAGCADTGVIIIDGNRCAVRKLTPLECWRLFDFSDSDFYVAKLALEQKHYKGRDKASSQLYKQAGNTIVVPVLEAIFRNIKGLNKS